jgi:hypothetical protein
MLRPGAVVVMLALTPLAVAGQRSFAFRPDANQRLEIQNGTSVLIEERLQAAVAVTVTPISRSRGRLELAIRNLSGSSVNVLDSDIAATAGTRVLKVHTYKDLQKEERRRQGWAAFGAGLQAASNNINAANAGYSHQYGSYQGNTTANVYGSNGYAYGTAQSMGTYSGTTYNAAAASAAQQAANAQNQQVAAAVVEQGRENMAALQSNVFRSNTVQPGTRVGGIVLFELPPRRKDAPPILISIKVGADTYSFALVEE